MLSVVLWGKGEVVHSLSLFQGYMVEDWLPDAVLTVLRGNTDDIVGSYRMVAPDPGKVGSPGLHILWWSVLL